MTPVEGKMNAAGKRVAIICSRWNELITNALLDGAIAELRAHGNPETTVARVAGTWEIPVVAKLLLQKDCDGAIALGCILQGATAHADLLAADVSRALMNLQVELGKPISWGILTPENQTQAYDRAGMKYGNKGREAALALIDSLSVLEQIEA